MFSFVSGSHFQSAATNYLRCVNDLSYIYRRILKCVLVSFPEINMPGGGGGEGTSVSPVIVRPPMPDKDNLVVGFGVGAWR
jgi:hypothetical protein